MKTPLEFLECSAKLIDEKRLLEIEYDHLSKIDMMTAAGNVIQLKIAKIEGQLKAMEWMISEKE